MNLNLIEVKFFLFYFSFWGQEKMRRMNRIQIDRWILGTVIGIGSEMVLKNYMNDS